MCSPAAVVAVVAVVSAAYSAKQQSDQADFEEGVAKYNARVAENEAEQTRNAGIERENIQRRKAAELLSRQRAQLASANLDLSSGSPLQLQEDTQILAEVDALRIRRNFNNQADALDQSSVLTRSQGKFAKTAGKNAAIGTLLKGAGTASSALAASS